jgi:hypothetical protein
MNSIMPAQVLKPKENTTGATLTGKKTAPKSSKKETYVIYSIYYTDEPEKGYAVYANNQSGWDFFCHMSPKQATPITEPQHRRFNINLL